VTGVDALAMSRYLAFAGVALTVLRVVVEAARAIRAGQPVPRVVIRRAAYLPLVGVIVYYVRALYVPGFDEPAALDVAAINTLYGLFFVMTAWPRRNRGSDTDQTRTFR